MSNIAAWAETRNQGDDGRVIIMQYSEHTAEQRWILDAMDACITDARGDLELDPQAPKTE